MFPQDTREIVVLGAGVIGLTTSLVLSHAYTSAKITVVAKHFPGDRSIECKPSLHISILSFLGGLVITHNDFIRCIPLGRRKLVVHGA
jgi:2-polyprenyl-6-methoxyphenol hydroxylase-like FAD-dependent oxidoreductase